MKAVLVVSLASLLLATHAGDAAAQPSAMAPGPALPAPPPEPPPLLSEGTASLLSLGGTVASWALVAAALPADDDTGGALGAVGLLGTYLAPTFGHWYAGSYVSRGLAIRTAGAASFVVGLAKGTCALDCSESRQDTALALIWGGLALYAAGTIDDILSAPGKVRRRNQRATGMGLAPLAVSGGGGLVLAGSF